MKIILILINEEKLDCHSQRRLSITAKTRFIFRNEFLDAVLSVISDCKSSPKYLDHPPTLFAVLSERAAAAAAERQTSQHEHTLEGGPTDS